MKCVCDVARPQARLLAGPAKSAIAKEWPYLLEMAQGSTSPANTTCNPFGDRLVLSFPISPIEEIRVFLASSIGKLRMSFRWGGNKTAFDCEIVVWFARCEQMHECETVSCLVEQRL
jgi:hypothetical protein